MAVGASTKGITILLILFFVGLISIGAITVDVSPVKLGYVEEVQGVLKLKAHPALTEIVPTLMVYALETETGALIYLTENGMSQQP